MSDAIEAVERLRVFADSYGLEGLHYSDARAVMAELAAKDAEIARLRDELRDAPCRADYNSDKSFVDAWRNWRWQYRPQLRDALKGTDHE